MIFLKVRTDLLSKIVKEKRYLFAFQIQKEKDLIIILAKLSKLLIQLLTLIFLDKKLFKKG